MSATYSIFMFVAVSSLPCVSVRLVLWRSTANSSFLEAWELMSIHHVTENAYFVEIAFHVSTIIDLPIWFVCHQMQSKLHMVVVSMTTLENQLSLDESIIQAGNEIWGSFMYINDFCKSSIWVFLQVMADTNNSLQTLEFACWLESALKRLQQHLLQRSHQRKCQLTLRNKGKN